MFLFFFNDTATTEIYTLSLHDALPICRAPPRNRTHSRPGCRDRRRRQQLADERSEEHTSELQSRLHLVCRLLLEKKKQTTTYARAGPRSPRASRCRRGGGRCRRACVRM